MNALPRNADTGELLFDLTQHPCSLYCTLIKETTASALFSPAGGLSDHMHDRYEIPKHWVHSQVVRRIVAAGRTSYLFFQSALRAGAFSEVL